MKQSKRLTKDNPYYWIQKYALAQCELGIERTLFVKNSIIKTGEWLDEQPIWKLEKLIKELRKEYLAVQEANQIKARRVKAKTTTL